MLNTPTQGESVCGVRFLRHVSTSQLVVGVCMCFLSVTSESHDRITEIAEGSHWKNLGEEVSEIVCSGPRHKIHVDDVESHVRQRRRR